MATNEELLVSAFQEKLPSDLLLIWKISSAISAWANDLINFWDQTNKEILVSAFHEKVSSRSSSYLSNIHSSVSQLPDYLLGANNFKTTLSSFHCS